MTIVADLFLPWGNDLVVGPTGDLAVVSGDQLGQQRVLRRLLTNQGDYIWAPVYGAGLAGFVGAVANKAGIEAVIRSQIFQEAAVMQSPAPTVDISSVQTGLYNTISATVKYTDTTSNQTQTLNFAIGT